MNKRTEAIKEHGSIILEIFPDALKRDPVELHETLVGLEEEAGKIATAHCNGELTEEVYEAESTAIMERVNELLGNHHPEHPVPIFFNGDPRGYTLKMNDDYVTACEPRICRDWGGYGILAPNISERGW